MSKSSISFLLLLLAGFALVGHAAAQSGGGYALIRSTVDSGGIVNASGGSYRMSSTVGQSDATEPATGGGYTLTGGFWHGASSLPTAIQLGHTNAETAPAFTLSIGTFLLGAILLLWQLWRRHQDNHLA